VASVAGDRQGLDGLAGGPVGSGLGTVEARQADPLGRRGAGPRRRLVADVVADRPHC